MSDLIRFYLTSDCRARIARLLPDATEADFKWLQQIVTADGLLTADGNPHPAFVAWVQAILDRRDGAAGVAAVVPVKPVPGAAGALIGGAV